MGGGGEGGWVWIEFVWKVRGVNVGELFNDE